jgi:DNA primase
MHSEGFKRNLVLYGEHRKEDDVDGNVYLVEGHLDMLMLWQHGYRPVVAMLGSYPGRCQIEKLIAYWGRRITIIPDGDKAGEDMVVKVKQLVADRVPVVSRKLPSKADAASVIRSRQLGKIDEDRLVEILGPPSVAV